MSIAALLRRQRQRHALARAETAARKAADELRQNAGNVYLVDDETRRRAAELLEDAADRLEYVTAARIARMDVPAGGLSSGPSEAVSGAGKRRPAGRDDELGREGT